MTRFIFKLKFKTTTQKMSSWLDRVHLEMLPCLPHPPLYLTSVQLLSCVQLFATPWTAACQASLSITNSWSLLKIMSIKSVMSSNHLILSSPSPPTVNLSQHQGPFKWMSQFFASCGQNIGVSTLASVLPMNIQNWFP